MIAILFDLDGTLTHTFYGDDNSYLTALSKQLSVDPNQSYWKECKHLTDEHVLHYFFQKKKGRKATVSERNQMQSDFLENMKLKLVNAPEFFEPINGAKAILSALQTNQIPFGVATGGWRHMAEFKLRTAKLLDDYPIMGSDFYETKAGFTYALAQQLKRRNPSIKRFVYVGDSLYDERAATKLGMDFIGIDVKRTGKLKDSGIKNVLQDFSNQEEFFRLLHAQ